MVEEVKTGGLKKFVYPKGYKPEDDKELKKFIEEAYKRQDRIRIIKLILVILILLILILTYLSYFPKSI